MRKTNPSLEKNKIKNLISFLFLDPFLSLPSLHKMPTILLSKLVKTYFIETRSTAFKSFLTKNELLPYESNLKRIPYSEKWSHSICNTKGNTTFRYQFMQSPIKTIISGLTKQKTILSTIRNI